MADVRQDYEFPAGPPHRFAPWRDEYGRLHENIPRCSGYTRPRNSWSKSPGECHRKGVVQRGAFDLAAWHGERWYCLQHDPARRDEKLVAEAASTMRDLLVEALELMPRTKRAAAWRERAQVLLDRTEARHAH
jgi:hypothetical protein